MKRRMYAGKLLDADNELDAITRRQSMTVIRTPESYPLDMGELKPKRDLRYVVAAIGIGVLGAAFVVGLIIAVLESAR